MRGVCAALATVTVLGAALVARAGPSDPLAEHRWSHRLLLVFFDDASGSAVHAWRDALAASTCELTQRDLIVAWLEAGRGGELDGKTVSAARAATLGRELGVDAGDFAVVLIGKDGDTKARYTGAPDLPALLSLIDGMPMRRAEAARRGADCSN